MSLQSVTVKFALMFAFIVFYLHYVRNINQYIIGQFSTSSKSGNIPVHSLKNPRSRGNSQQTTQSHNQWLNSFQKYIDDLQYNKTKTRVVASNVDVVPPITVSSKSKPSSYLAEVAITSNPKQTKTSVIPNAIIVPLSKQKVSSESKEKSKLQLKSPHLLHLKESITEFAKSNEMIDNDTSTTNTGMAVNHPRISPRQGSDISSETKQFQLISCPDQSNCIIPTLQLQLDVASTSNSNQNEKNDHSNNNKQQQQQRQKLIVYLCKPPKHHGGVRFMYLVREGLMTHPSVHFLTSISDIHTADYIFFLPGSSPWQKTDCYISTGTISHVTDNNKNHGFMKDTATTAATHVLPSSSSSLQLFNIYTASQYKLIVLDEFDGPTPLYEPFQTLAEMMAHSSSSGSNSNSDSNDSNDNNSRSKSMSKNNDMLPWYNMYFKRSFVKRHNGIFVGYPHIHSTTTNNNHHHNRHEAEVYPLTYPLAEAYVRSTYNTVREIDLLCTLRGSKAMITRLRVQEWVTEYAQVRQIPNAITQSLNKATRTSINKAYFEHMHNAKIIVTVNPADWEGDFRLWESLASGALVFVDPLFVPHPYPLLDGVHVVYFSNHNKTELWSKLDYFLTHPLVMQQVARNGYLYAMKHHRAVNLIDYVLCSAHLKRIVTNNAEHNNMSKVSFPQYSYTAQYLNYEAKRQEQHIKQTKVPGLYLENVYMYNHTHLTSS